MNVSEVYNLRRQGKIEKAYNAIRMIYATDKSTYAAKALFWTAVDILRKRGLITALSIYNRESGGKNWLQLGCAGKGTLS